MELRNVMCYTLIGRECYESKEENMANPSRSLQILLYLLFLLAPLYAQNIQQSTFSKIQLTQFDPLISFPKEKTNNTFLTFLNKESSAVYKYDIEEREKDEKKILREKWKRAFGIDIFSPYFKAKEIEDRFSEKISLRLYKIKGKPKIEDNQIKYIFKLKF